MPKQKIKGWLRRYLPAEIIGTFAALGAAGLAHTFSKSGVVLAYAGTIGETIGFYSTVFVQNIIIIGKKHKLEGVPFTANDLLKITRHLLVEFGPAGLLDDLVSRPFFMYLFPVLLKNVTLGILVGKLVADATFYFFVIISYERVKKRVAKQQK